MKSYRAHVFHLVLFCFSLIIFGCTPVLSQNGIELRPWGASYKQPVQLIPWMDDDFILIEKAGLVKTVDEKGNELNEVLDLKDEIAKSGGERGLLGISLHPSYPDSPYIYLDHTDDNNNTAIVRYVFQPESDHIDPSTRKVLLTIEQPYSNHNGGCVTFGPDGFLYIGMGDGGSGGDPENRAQNLKSLLGKILRIDVDNGDPYAIPEDNPFIDNPDARDEIWSYGWRNPWRFSFDRMTGDLWVGDVGQNKVEEISFEAADAEGGMNYGWRCYEGDQPYEQSGNCDGPFVDPVITRTHAQGDRSITGGFRYRGPVEEWKNRYFFADYVSGNIYMAILSDSEEPSVDSLLTIDKKNSIASFAEDREGNLFALSLSGQIYSFFLSCNVPAPELREHSPSGDSIGLVTDSIYQQYIWNYSENSDQKADFSAIDTTESPVFYSPNAGNYFVTVVDSNGCRGDSQILSFPLSTTEAIDFYDIKIFPNPVSDYVTIKTEQTVSDTRIEISNSQGQLIRRIKTTLPATVSLQNMPIGVYILKFLAGNKRYVAKIVKR